jgi:hypothetical protein
LQPGGHRFEPGILHQIFWFIAMRCTIFDN